MAVETILSLIKFRLDRKILSDIMALTYLSQGVLFRLDRKILSDIIFGK